jgi:cob(I)alamin adenosyltransferase
MTTTIDEVLKKHHRGLVLVYTGDGKGKTTAALGQALRAVGHSRRVLLLQFMKGRETGEELAARSFNTCLTIKSFNKNLNMIGDSPSPQDIAEAKEGIAEARRALIAGECDLLIMDEANVAVALGLLDEDELIALARLIQDTPLKTDLILTGRYASAEIVKIADTVSEFAQLKHHYYAGIEERAGIEY